MRMQLEIVREMMVAERRLFSDAREAWPLPMTDPEYRPTDVQRVQPASEVTLADLERGHAVSTRPLMS